MKLVLICPSNRLYMPYVNYYEQQLKKHQVDYDILYWDRFHMEPLSNNIYRDKKRGHHRNYLDYIGYKKFVQQRLKAEAYDKIIVFSVQLAYFLKDTLLKLFHNRFIWDIRDYHPLMKLIVVNKLMDGSVWTVISSLGYKQWLPVNDKLVVQHNTAIGSLDDLSNVEPMPRKTIRISTIGATRDVKINQTFIAALANHPTFELSYHGQGDGNEAMAHYAMQQAIHNVSLTGRYEAHEEQVLYEQSDLIQILRTAKGMNNQTALPNRLYQAPFYGKPLLALTGSYVAEVIATYDLGLVVDSFDQLDQQIERYIATFNSEQYDAGRRQFFQQVLADNAQWSEQVAQFLLPSNTFQFK